MCQRARNWTSSVRGTVEEARVNLVEAVEGFLKVASPSEIRWRLKKEMYILPILPTLPKPRVKSTARSRVAYTPHGRDAHVLLRRIAALAMRESATLTFIVTDHLRLRGGKPGPRQRSSERQQKRTARLGLSVTRLIPAANQARLRQPRSAGAATG